VEVGQSDGEVQHRVIAISGRVRDGATRVMLTLGAMERTNIDLSTLLEDDHAS
jgi:hypothetical protein